MFTDNVHEGGGGGGGVDTDSGANNVMESVEGSLAQHVSDPPRTAVFPHIIKNGHKF